MKQKNFGKIYEKNFRRTTTRRSISGTCRTVSTTPKGTVCAGNNRILNMDNDGADKLIKTISDFKKSVVGQTITIMGKQYATVGVRLAIARRNLGTSLDLKSTVIFQDEKKVIVQVEAYIDEKHCSTGLAEEYRAASRINQTSALEVAETSAAGRALAMLGLTNDNIASAEEVSAAITSQNKSLTNALNELDKISHLGSYKAWISKHSELFKKIKINDPLAYQSFQEKFSKIKKTMEIKGVITNGRSTTN